MATPVLPIDVLNHFFTAIVLDVEIDIGRLSALLRYEALEEKPHTHRIDGGDPQAVANRRVGGRAASLTEDVLLSAVPHDLPHREEIPVVLEVLNDGELHFELS